MRGFGRRSRSRGRGDDRSRRDEPRLRSRDRGAPPPRNRSRSANNRRARSRSRGTRAASPPRFKYDSPERGKKKSGFDVEKSKWDGPVSATSLQAQQAAEAAGLQYNPGLMQQITGNAQVLETLEFQHSHVKFIIGKGGEFLRNVELQCRGAFVRIDQNPAENKCICRIQGPLQAVKAAAAMIQLRIITLTDGDINDVPDGYVIQQIVVRPYEIKKILGPKGATLRQIELETSTQVTVQGGSWQTGKVSVKKTKMCAHWEQGICTKGFQCTFAHGQEEIGTSVVKGTNDMQGSGGEMNFLGADGNQLVAQSSFGGLSGQIVRIAGTNEGVALCVQKINEKLDHFEDLQIEQSKMGRIIGKGGVTLKEIKDATGGNIWVDQSTQDQGWSIVRIKDPGTPQHEAAKRMILQKLGPGTWVNSLGCGVDPSAALAMGMGMDQSSGLVDPSITNQQDPNQQMMQQQMDPNQQDPNQQMMQQQMMQQQMDPNAMGMAQADPNAMAVGQEDPNADQVDPNTGISQNHGLGPNALAMMLGEVTPEAMALTPEAIALAHAQGQDPNAVAMAIQMGQIDPAMAAMMGQDPNAMAMAAGQQAVAPVWAIGDPTAVLAGHAAGNLMQASVQTQVSPHAEGEEDLPLPQPVGEKQVVYPPNFKPPALPDGGRPKTHLLEANKRAKGSGGKGGHASREEALAAARAQLGGDSVPDLNSYVPDMTQFAIPLTGPNAQRVGKGKGKGKGKKKGGAQAGERMPLVTYS